MFAAPIPSRTARLAVVALALAGSLTAARAQTYANPNLPRSPYGLPEPTYRGDPDDRDGDVEDLINGNGRLHSSGQWRHWGDSRNSGELFGQLFAPNGSLDLGQGVPNRLPTSRYCARHPGDC